jgi:hypothetical protein
MSAIILQRHNEYVNSQRGYRIFIDGVEAGKIGNGETKSYAVAAGSRKVMAKIDWCGSEEIEVYVKEGESVTVAVSGFRFSNWLMPLSSGIIALHFILGMTIDFSYLIFLVIPVLLGLIYLLTIGKNKYLRLRCTLGPRRPFRRRSETGKADPLNGLLHPSPLQGYQ